MVSTAVEKMKANGVKTVAYIGFSDALGDLAYDSLLKSTEAADIKVVSNERYARGDSSVTGQILKIVALKPDAVFTGTSGTPGALPYLALADRGYKGQLYGTHGLVNAEFVRVGGAAVDGLMVPSGPVMVADQLPDSNPTKKVSLEFRKIYEKVQGAPPADAFSAYTFDAVLLFDDAAGRALKKGGEPGTPAFRVALRDAIESTHEFAGTHGVFTYKPGDPNGLDKRGAVMIKLDKGQWKLMP
jgi:branched-chain amino acid transport system substrate-binding protein